MLFGSDSPLKFAVGAAVVAVGMGTQFAHMPLGDTMGAPARPALAASQTQPAIPQVERRSPGGGRRVVIDADRFGQFQADVEIEGRIVPMMVDTGATAISLSWSDAASMGIQPAPYEFTVRMRTANGIARAALVRLRQVRVGDIVVNDVKAVVSPPGQTTPNLLGMTFLGALGHFQISDRRLVLEQ